MSYRLLFLDLDGTLVGREDRVSVRNAAALRAANEAGCTVVICTARTQHAVTDIASHWHGHGYGIFVNGAVIAEWETGLLLQTVRVAEPVVRSAVHAARECGLSLLLYGVDVENDRGRLIYADPKQPTHAGWWATHAERTSRARDPLAGPTPGPLSFAVYGAREPVEAAAALWRERLQNVDIFCAYDAPYGGWCAYGNASEANKASAARRVAQMLNIPREQTMAIGDQVNDVELLRWAGLGVAMGDGHLHALTVADHVTSAQHADGVADAVERFVLGRF